MWDVVVPAIHSGILHDSAVATITSERPCFPDLATWENRPATQMIPEKVAVTSPYIGGSAQNPRDIRTLRRWRKSLPRRGPTYLKIGGRYFYTIGALRDFYERSVRGDFR